MRTLKYKTLLKRQQYQNRECGTYSNRLGAGLVACYLPVLSRWFSSPQSSCCLWRCRTLPAFSSRLRSTERAVDGAMSSHVPCWEGEREWPLSHMHTRTHAHTHPPHRLSQSALINGCSAPTERFSVCSAGPLPVAETSARYRGWGSLIEMSQFIKPHGCSSLSVLGTVFFFITVSRLHNYVTSHTKKYNSNGLT